MKYIVTGSAGFIGSHLSEFLLNNQHEVLGIDNLEDFYSPAIKEENLSILQQFDNFSFSSIDLRDQIQTESIFSDYNPDVVIHLAGKGGVRPSIENPQVYLESNIQATQNVLEAMKGLSSKKLVFASSSSVYGNNKKTPFSEKDDVSFPISPYAFTKKSCELLNHTYHHLYDIDVVNLRFFTVFGPRQRPDLAIHKFVNKLYKGKPIDKYGDGSTARDYTYVADTIQGIIKTTEYLTSNNSVFETLNLGNHYPISLNDMISTIEDCTNKKFIINQLPMQPGDVEITYADIQKAKNIIGYQPKIAFHEGIQKFVEWYTSKNQ